MKNKKLKRLLDKLWEIEEYNINYYLNNVLTGHYLDDEFIKIHLEELKKEYENSINIINKYIKNN